MFRNRMGIWILGCAVALTLPACGDSDEADDEADAGTTAQAEEGSASEADTETESTTGADTGGIDDAEGDTESEAAEDVVRARILIPPDFDGSPVLLSAMFFAIDSEGGMPDAFGDSIANPGIVAGEAFDLTTTQAGLDGDYYLDIVLYCEGGGNGQFPVIGVDWWAETESSLTLGPGTGAIDAGDIPLFLSDDD